VLATYKYNVLFSIILKFQKISIPTLRVIGSLKGEVVSKAEMIILEISGWGGGTKRSTGLVLIFSGLKENSFFETD